MEPISRFLKMCGKQENILQIFKAYATYHFPLAFLMQYRLRRKSILSYTIMNCKGAFQMLD